MKPDSKKRVLLVNPKLKSVLVGLESSAVPFALLYLAAKLEQEHVVHLHDETVSPQNIGEVVREFKPDFVGISANFSFQFPRAVQIATEIKSYDKTIKTVVGGTHITSTRPDIILQKHSSLDFLIRGDGEIPLFNLVSGETPGQIEGLAYRANGAVEFNGIFFLDDLDKVPFPARHLVNPKDYSVPPIFYSDHHHTYFFTSRGCAFNCTFCAGAKERFRKRSVANVIEEMKLVYEQGYRYLLVGDPCFTTDVKRAEKLCDAMVKENVKLSWGCAARADVVNAQLLQKMSKAGCEYIFYGIESGSPHVLEKIKKKVTLDQMRDAVQMTKAAGMKNYGGVMVGYPFETEDDFKQTLNFSNSVGLDAIFFNIVTPLPGTELWDLTDHDEYDLETLEKILLYSGELSFWDQDLVKKCHNDIIRSFYYRPKIVFNLLMDLLTRGTLRRRFDLFKTLFLTNPLLNIENIKNTVFQSDS